MALFGKDASPPRASSPSRPDAAGIVRSSSLGGGIVVEGTISGREDLAVEATVKGRINLEADLRIGPNAQVEASVHARNVVVEGTLVGDISADARVELTPSAKVDGNIKAPKIVVAEGAMFKGAVDMGSSEGKGKREASEPKEKNNVGQRDGKS
jgi:cytoskeletal protein CcmA (bactofilin family)